MCVCIGKVALLVCLCATCMCFHVCCQHMLLEHQISAFAPALLANMVEETKNLDVASDSDLTECPADLASDEEEEEIARMHILLLQANWAKPRRKRKAMTAKTKRKRFTTLLKTRRPHT